MAKIRANAGAVFERHENKYMLSPAQYRALRSALEPDMAEDQYGLHTICTVYYDTADFAIIRHSLEKPKFKEKLRLRSYGVPGEDTKVFLELKKKLDGITYKRRIALPLWQAEQYLRDGTPPAVEAQSQIYGEIDWFVGQHHPAAKALLCYDRIALFGKEDPELRVTFDTDIRWRDYNLSLALGDYGSSLLESGNRLMEIKIQGAMPFWLSHTLSQLAIYPISFSKYGTVYRDHLQFKEEIRYAG